jgi:hypothetical protein
MEGHRAIGLRLNLVKEEVLVKEVLKLGRHLRAPPYLSYC